MENEESENLHEEEDHEEILSNISRLQKFNTVMFQIYQTGEFSDFNLLSKDGTQFPCHRNEDEEELRCFLELSEKFIVPSLKELVERSASRKLTVGDVPPG